MKSVLQGALLGVAPLLPELAVAADNVPQGAGAAIQTLLALGVVIAVIAALAWAARRAGAAPRTGSRLRLVSGLSVGTRERVVIIETGETWLVLGVAPGRVSALHTLPRPADAVAGTEAPGTAAGAFAEIIGKLRQGRAGTRDAG